MTHTDITIGTLVKAEQNAAEYIRQILPHGFECFQLVFRRHLEDVDLPALSSDARQNLILGQLPGDATAL